MIEVTRTGPAGLVFPRGPSVVERRWGRQLWVESRPSWTQAGWWDAELSPRVRELLAVPLGAQLMSRLLTLGGEASGECGWVHPVTLPEDRIGVAGSPCACQIVLAAAWQAAASWTTLRADRAVVAAVGSRPVRVALRPGQPQWGSVTDPAVEEIAVALRCSPASMRNLIHRVRAVTVLPVLSAAVSEGLLIGWHAGLVAADISHLKRSDRVDVVDALVARLRERHTQGLTTWTFTDVRAWVRRFVARSDPDAGGRRRRCHAGRGVRLRIDGDGQASVIATLPEDTATRIFRRLTAMAHALGAADASLPPDQARSLDHRRADVLTDLILDRPAVAGEPAGEVAVVVDLATLLRAAEHPGRVPGAELVPAEIARQIAADRRWRAWITDPDGTVLATGTRSYRPSAGLARLIRAREPYCRMPGCRNSHTDLDHTVPYPKGPTSGQNLGALCRRHHRMKTHARWRLANDPDGFTWFTPAGITHADRPDPPLRD